MSSLYHPCKVCSCDIYDKRTKRCSKCWWKFKQAPIHERFFRLVEKTDSCWIWKGGQTGHGYGIYHELGQSGAHRVSWIIKNGKIPDKKLILHKCDVRICVNPDHLFLGTQKENIHDAMIKNRRAIGENHGMAKLTSENVKEIRNLFDSGKTRPELQTIFKVSKYCIYSITKRLTWKNLS